MNTLVARVLAVTYDQFYNSTYVNNAVEKVYNQPRINKSRAIYTVC
jgi:hypothetical protein